MNFDNVMLSEKSQLHIVNYSICMKSPEEANPYSRLVVTHGWVCGVAANWSRAPCWSNENVLKFTVVMIIQQNSEYTQKHWFVSFKWWIRSQQSCYQNPNPNESKVKFLEAKFWIADCFRWSWLCSQGPADYTCEELVKVQRNCL